MKRLLALLLLSVMLLSMLISCEDNKNPEYSENGSTDGEDNQTNEKDPPKKGNNIGNLATDFDLNYVIGDGKESIKNYRGKVVILNFWGTWCGPCKSELTHFNTLAQEYADDAVFFLVHSVYGIDEAPEFITNRFSDSKMVFVKDQPLSKTSDMYYTLMGGKGTYPRTVVLDRFGVITFYIDQAISYDALKTEIEKAKK